MNLKKVVSGFTNKYCCIPDECKNIKLQKVSELKGDEPILVSVICNCFNHQKYIRHCLNGFLNQLVDFGVEILVHDDASTDKSKRIIEEISSNYKCFNNIYQKENQHSKGVSISLNLQIPRARGKYIAFCEGDDIWIDPYKLFLQIHYLEEHPECSCSLHNSLLFDMGKLSKQIYLMRKPKFDSYTLEDSFINRCHFSSLIFKKELILEDKPNYFSFKKPLDGKLKIFLASKGDVKYIDRPMSLYRWHSSKSAWSFKSSNDYVKNLNASIDFYEELKKEFPNYTNFFNNRIIKAKFDSLVLHGNIESLNDVNVVKEIEKLPIETQKKIYSRAKHAKCFRFFKGLKSKFIVLKYRFCIFINNLDKNKSIL